MKKLLALIIILCFMAVQSHAGVAILAGGAGFKTQTFNAVTLQFDTAMGFVSDSSIDFRSFQNRKITITSTAGNYVIAWIGGQSSSGERYGSAQNTSNNQNGTNGGGVSNIYNTFSGVSSTGFTAVCLGSGYCIAGTAQQISYTSGALYLASFNISLVSGALPTGNFRQGIGSGTSILTSIPVTSGANAEYCTATTTMTGVWYLGQTQYQASSFALSGLTVERVTAPSNGSTAGAYGCILTQTPGGSQGVTSITGSPYNASSYTVTISAS